MAAGTGGEYAGKMTATAAGIYNVSLLQLSSNGTSARIASFPLEVAAAGADLLASRVWGGGLTSATVGQPAQFWVRADPSQVSQNHNTCLPLPRRGQCVSAEPWQKL